MHTTTQALETFEANRPFLMGLAYRLLGRYTEAEDLVQETYLRWHRSANKIGELQNPRAYLSRILTRLCLDYLKSARVRREEYIGPWLPEPVLEGQLSPVFDSPEHALDAASDVSYALMMTLERLSPLERAVFILHDIFAMPFAELADMLERTEAACRQLASRARKHVQEERKRYQTTSQMLSQLIPAFWQAAATQNVEALSKMLAEDAIVYTDGGGIVHAALRPILGAYKTIQFFCGLHQKFPKLRDAEWRLIVLNNGPALLGKDTEGLTQVTLFSLDENNQIHDIYVIRNPEKLGHLLSPQESLKDFLEISKDTSAPQKACP